MNIQDIRKEYAKQRLDEAELVDDPIVQFEKWLNEAISSEAKEPTAMTLSTASLQGKPSSRIVLLKGVNENGFIFYTNYESKKGKELAENPQASLNFHWAELERQVRIEGIVEKISEEASTAYFLSRPKGSQIGAIASPQSEVIPNRQYLEQKVATVEEEANQSEALKKPNYWGGYCLHVNYIEFWQGRPSRLHDRIVFDKSGGSWTIKRLAP